MKASHPTKINTLALFLITFLFPFILKSEISFTDSAFEKAVRQKVERGWLWVPNYTGINYQFTEQDFMNVSYLSFDAEEQRISSLSDLQWFPNLLYLDIWDASHISDFSPIWSFSEQLLGLSINGSRGANLSGVSTMNALEYLDLDDNQLTELSVLGSHPKLIELWIAENYLELGNPQISGIIASFSDQIYQNRASKGWWWSSSDPVEYELQYPKSFQDLSHERNRIQQILVSSPNDAKANLLKGIYTLLNIVESNEATGLKEFAVSVGVDSSIRNFVLSDLSMLEDYDAELSSSFQLGELAELLEFSIIPDLEEVDLYFSRVPPSSVIELDQEITGSENIVTVDYGDVLVLRTITNCWHV